MPNDEQVKDLIDDLDFATAERSDAAAEYAKALLRLFDAEVWHQRALKKLEEYGH